MQFKEEINAMDCSEEADQAAASGDWRTANRAADQSEEHATNAENIAKATS